MSELHVWKNDIVEWFVAESESEVWELWHKETGENRVDYIDMDFSQIDDSESLTVRYDDLYDVPSPLPDGGTLNNENGIRVTATCGAWAKQNGKGLLCTTEY